MAAEDNQIGHDEGLYKTLYFDYEDEVRHRVHHSCSPLPPAQRCHTWHGTPSQVWQR